MSTNYAESIAEAQRKAGKLGEKKKRDAGLSADIAAELKGALDEPLAVGEIQNPVPPDVSVDAEAAAGTPPAAAVVESARVGRETLKAASLEREASQAVDVATRVAPDREPMFRQGVDFRRADLDLITDMLYRCHQHKIKLQGKKGPSIIVRAALDELAAIYSSEPKRFDAIMSRYVERKKVPVLP